MAKTVEITADDWEKLFRLHEVLGELLFTAQGTLENLLVHGVDSPYLEKSISDLYRRMSPMVKTLFLADEPFDIVPVRGVES